MDGDAIARARGGASGDIAMDDRKAAPAGAAGAVEADGLALVARMIEQAAEQRAAALVAQRLARELEAARDQAWMEGFVQGQGEEREAWRKRLRALLGEAEQDTEAGVASTDARRPGAGQAAPDGLMTGADGTAADGPSPQPEDMSPAQSGGEAEGDRPMPMQHQRPPAPPAPTSARNDDGDGDGQPPEEPPAPQAVIAPPGWQDWRTPAREARLRELWRIPAYSQREIWEDLKLVAGPAMPSDQANLAHWARKLNLPPRPVRQAVQPAASNTARGVEAAQQRALAAAPSPARIGPPVLPRPSAGKVYASFREIRDWAQHYGIAFDGSNVHVVNAKRKALGLPPVVVDEDRTAADTRAA